MKIKRNAVKCVHCGKEIESVAMYDMQVHVCKALLHKRKRIAVAGGLDYLRRLGEAEDMVEISEYAER